MHAENFNQDIGDWNVSNVVNMHRMFFCAYDFNQDIGDWNVSSVTRMSELFLNANSFNQNLTDWDVSHVENMYQMFYNAASFKGNISMWDISSATNLGMMFTGATLPTPIYDNLLINWSQLPLKSGVTFSGGNSKYSAGDAANARAYIISTYGWSIMDGGIVL